MSAHLLIVDINQGYRINKGSLTIRAYGTTASRDTFLAWDLDWSNGIKLDILSQGHRLRPLKFKRKEKKRIYIAVASKLESPAFGAGSRAGSGLQCWLGPNDQGRTLCLAFS